MWRAWRGVTCYCSVACARSLTVQSAQPQLTSRPQLAEYRSGFARVSVTLNSHVRDKSSRSLISLGAVPRSLISLGAVPRTTEEALQQAVFCIFDDTTPFITNVSVEDVDTGMHLGTLRGGGCCLTRIIY